MNEPDATTLRQWLQQWSAIRQAHYRALVESYTPEQRAIIAQMQQAARQVTLCRDRMQRRTGVRPQSKLAWPKEPPT